MANANETTKAANPPPAPTNQPPKAARLPPPPALPPALRTDGPTLEDWIAEGYDAKDYPPRGYAVRESPKYKMRVSTARGIPHRNRAGERFDPTPRTVEVTAAQRKLIEEDPGLVAHRIAASDFGDDDREGMSASGELSSLRQENAELRQRLARTETELDTARAQLASLERSTNKGA